MVVANTVSAIVITNSVSFESDPDYVTKDGDVITIGSLFFEINFVDDAETFRSPRSGAV